MILESNKILIYPELLLVLENMCHDGDLKKSDLNIRDYIVFVAMCVPRSTFTPHKIIQRCGIS